MAITTGDCTDGVRTGLAGRIANKIVAAMAAYTPPVTVLYPAGTGSDKNHVIGLNKFIEAVVDALNLDKIDAVAQIDGANPVVVANSAAGQTIANGATPIIVFGTEEKDSDNAYDNTTGRFTIPAGKGGDYLVIASTLYSVAMPTGPVALYICKNAAIQKTGQFAQPLANQPINASTVLPSCAAGDILDIRTAHNEAAGKALSTNAQFVYVAIKRLS